MNIVEIPITIAEAEQAIQEIVESTDAYTMSDPMLEWLLHLTQSWIDSLPFLAEKLTDKELDTLLREKAVSAAKFLHMGLVINRGRQ